MEVVLQDWRLAPWSPRATAVRSLAQSAFVNEDDGAALFLAFFQLRPARIMSRSAPPWRLSRRRRHRPTNGLNAHSFLLSRVSTKLIVPSTSGTRSRAFTSIVERRTRVGVRMGNVTWAAGIITQLARNITVDQPSSNLAFGQPLKKKRLLLVDAN